jgi:hypothetical protein
MFALLSPNQRTFSLFSPGTMTLQILLMGLLAAPALGVENEILTVSPSSAEAGTSNLTVTFTLDSDLPPPPPAGAMPDSVTIGSLSGTSVTHTNQYIVTAVFDISAGEADGARDAIITFTPGLNTVNFTKTGGFTVGTAAASNAYTNGAPSAGYNLFGALNSTDTYLMDNDENIIKTWTSSYTPGNSVYLLEDGSLMRTANTGSSVFISGGQGGRVEQFDWDGALIWAYDYDTASHRSHHDIEVLPNGNILMIAWELKTEAEALAAGRKPSLLTQTNLWPDTIIEVAPTGSYGGDIVWEWHSWDHLVQDYDASKDNYGTVSNEPGRININYAQNGNADWHHINAVDYSADLDQIILSVRNLSEIWVIDHDTTTSEAAGSAGDLLYRWGNPEAYDSGDANDQQLFVQHDAQWIEDGLAGEGNILIFNNGQGRLDGNYSSVVEIEPPVAGDGSYTNGLPAAPTWIYINAIPTNFYSSNISGAQRLPNGNTLICEGAQRYAFEVTPDGDLVWDYANSGSIFRFERYAPDFLGFIGTELALSARSYAIVDTAQDGFYDDSVDISEPGTNDAFYGQDGCYDGNQPAYLVSPDGLTVYDYNTGLTWTRSHDWNGDGDLDADDKMLQSVAVTYAATLNTAEYGGHSDWRLPSIKELYSLMDFRGTDPNVSATDSSGLTPFIDDTVFEIGYGDISAGERLIDSQFATTTIYVDTVMNGSEAMFGLNLVDGRIKGYPTQNKTYYAYYCRGNASYGINDFAANGDGTVSDHATGLMWSQADSIVGMDWSNALAYAEASALAGHTDWRLPNTKELQGIVNYTRSPSTTASAAIDPVFSATQITNMALDADYPWYWTGTTHLKYTGVDDQGSYVCFGRGMGTMDGTTIIDVHGAGCQRSDPKTGDPGDYPSAGHGPQGDVRRVFNHVRIVRDLPPIADYDEDGLTDVDERGPYGTDPYDPDTDGDGVLDGDEVEAGTDAIDDTSYLYLLLLSVTSQAATLRWPSVTGRTYRLQWNTNLLSDTWITAKTCAPTAPTNTTDIPLWSESDYFYRVTVENVPYSDD